MKVVVVHQWDEKQTDTVVSFLNQIVDMAKNNKLPKGMKLEKAELSKENKIAICEWDVESLDLLMQAAKQFNISWKVIPFTPQVLY